jgi:hypothetical protein
MALRTSLPTRHISHGTRPFRGSEYGNPVVLRNTARIDTHGHRHPHEAKTSAQAATLAIVGDTLIAMGAVIISIAVLVQSKTLRRLQLARVVVGFLALRRSFSLSPSYRDSVVYQRVSGSSLVSCTFCSCT